MGKQQYNSSADRRWQRRYQRIQDRKESTFDFETLRDERRRMKRTMFRTRNIDIERMVPNKVAVLCTSPEQVRQLYRAIDRCNPEYTRGRSVEGLEDAFYCCHDAAVGMVTRDYVFFEETSIRVDSKRYFMNRAFEIIDFCELFPVKDLGNINESPETVEFLLGI